MSVRNVQLSDKYDLTRSPVLMNGVQALIRIMLTQHALDRNAGLNTAGYVTGYRGSPLGSVDYQMASARKELEQSNILFQPALNEDLAATALWGAQQAELRREGEYDGVFGMWYGKGPGVDRSGDALRHANFAGTSRYGGVLMAMGDDHTGESSTTLHQSEWALMDAYIPILSPAGVQEVLDFGLFGYALSRFSGNWVGLKCMKETIESTMVVDGSLDRFQFKVPEFNMPDTGLNIRLNDTPREQEARLIDYRRDAAEAIARVNMLDRRVHGSKGARIGIAAAGKNWLDVVHALEILELDHAELMRLGISTYKVGMTWPIESVGMRDWLEGLNIALVVEEKRKIIEPQIKELIFNSRANRRVVGLRNTNGELLFDSKYELDPVRIALGIGGLLAEEGLITERISRRLSRLEESSKPENVPDLLERKPYFCAGCPHSTSTRIPEGSRAYSGIGCHYMVQWMDRNTLGFTQMGGEGANWIGEAPFSKRGHVFQNIGDGTYNHSGMLAIKAAIYSGVNVTYKILFNDAVAMTGGQANEGGLTPGQVVNELAAMGVNEVALVYDAKEEIDLRKEIPRIAKSYERSQINYVQQRLSKVKGVSALVYVQTCAAEKRRRRKRDKFPKIDRRVFINPDICEGCGDCGLASNCVSIVPLETELGRKRSIDQSSCNMDLSCLNGFCPSFVTALGAIPKKKTHEPIDLPDIPFPNIPSIDGTYNTVITGVGGTGVVTIGAVMAMAAHLDRKGVGMIEMAGLAQKGGSVTIHCRISNTPEDLSAIRVASGEADTVLGGDLLVTASTSVLGLLDPRRSSATVNTEEIITGDFTRNTEFQLPAEELKQRLQSRLDTDGVQFIPASDLAKKLLGDSIFSNMLLFGAAWQRGSVPLNYEAIARAIELNGVNAERNKLAFEYGRHAAASTSLESLLGGSRSAEPVQLNPLEYRKKLLVAYQGVGLSTRYEDFVNRFDGSRLWSRVMKSYYKLLAIKDEYEVARLHLSTAIRIADEFEGKHKLRYHLSPPFLAGRDNEGRPKKHAFGEWMTFLFRVLAAVRRIRNTALDPFRNQEERRLQRRFIKDYEMDMISVLHSGVCESSDSALELAGLPLTVRGYGHVWKSNYEKAMSRRAQLLEMIELDAVKASTGRKGERDTLVA